MNRRVTRQLPSEVKGRTEMYLSASIGKASRLLVALGLAVSVPVASQAALVASDVPAGLIVFPKIELDSAGVLNSGLSVDTTVQLTNVSGSARAIHCFYVDGTRRCDVSGDPCRRTSDCSGGAGDFCGDSAWTANNFTMELSPNQTIGWNISSGITVPAPGDGAIPPVNQDPFIGELKCVEMTDTTTAALPINSNDLIGTVTTVSSSVAAFVDSRSYSAIGIPANIEDGSAQNDLTLCLGGTPGSTECPVPSGPAVSEYAACPRNLWMNLYFDGPVNGGSAQRSNRLTLVPCTENFIDTDDQPITTVQFLIYNEFEQRFSARTSVDCYFESPLVFIDSRVTGVNSVFSLGVQGTVGGQTLIRPLAGSETDKGHGLLGIGEQGLIVSGAVGPKTSAFNLNYTGVNPQGDFVRFVIP